MPDSANDTSPAQEPKNMNVYVRSKYEALNVAYVYETSNCNRQSYTILHNPYG